LIAAHTLGTAGARLSVQYQGASRTNLVLRSQEFENASWGKSNTTVSLNVTTAPDGTATADRLVPTVTNANHNVNSAAFSVTSGVAYTWSVYAKPDGYGWMRFSLNTGWGSNWAFFNLSTGELGLNSGHSNLTATSVGNGWWRFSGSATSNATTASATVSIFAVNANSFTTFPGDTVSGILAWGAQIEAGVLTSYIPTTSAAVASDWYNAASFVAPANDDPFAIVFPEQSATGWGIVLHAAVAQIGVAWIGPRLVIPGGVTPDIRFCTACDRSSQVRSNSVSSLPSPMLFHLNY
jgi:hypothetical protein